MSISSVLILIVGLLLPVTTAFNKPHLVQDDLSKLKDSVASALPSGWRVEETSKDKSVWRTVDSLREKYKGYQIVLAGPQVVEKITPKGQQREKEVTYTRTAVLFFIPVWSGINRAELDRDLSAAWEALKPPPMAQHAPGPSTEAYGWNKQYLLLCQRDCEILQRVAKKLKVPKR